MKFFIFLLMLAGCNGTSSSSSSLSSTVAPLSTFPGAVSAIIHEDEIKEISVTGIRKWGHAESVSSSDKFHLGSCTKAMTATLAAIIIEEGNLSWTTKLGEIFSDMEMRPEYRDMTFETLLIQRSGFPTNHPILNQVHGEDVLLGRKKITHTLLNLPPQNPVGTRYIYSNYNYIVAGHALEKSFWSFLGRSY